ncbi:MAG: single-stranded-DNA-specific exonuclease RecJ [Chloroflexota bacterium]|nr:single-stranded-DNA-specific exonuclease RecJ [Chloroflexota bacterium]
MRTWSEPQDVKVPPALRAAVGGHPLIARTLVRRGITDSREARAFLDPDLYRPAPPTELPHMGRAVERLERAIERGERIWVWGDFDVDGQTATTILVSTLRDLGASVQFHIPNRAREGHGIRLPILREIVAGGADVVLTCDTGVTAHDPIAYARRHDVDVIVTDHHDLPPELPEAYALTDPKMLPETHALRELPGVGVAYKLVELLYQRAGRAGGATQYHDLVALGIVADVAVQTGDVRYLLQRGLAALRHTERLGLQVLMEIIELNPHWLTEEHIGFELAPRLNALGRLADATPAVEFLTTDDLDRARILAHELDGLNARRKMLCDQVAQGAEAQIERAPSLLEQGALVLSHPSWPGSVVGIVAGRLAEKYHTPTVLIAAPPDELARGSARSIVGCDISAAIAAQGHMLKRFGGHPMAAGLSIDPERIPEFRRALSRTVRETCERALAEEPILPIDGYVPLSDLSLEFVEEVDRLAPFGPGNPVLTLATRGVSLRGYTTVGRTGEHLKLTVEDEEGGTQQVLWWRAEESALPQGPFDLAYAVRASDYRGQRDVQVEWIAACPIEEPTAVLHPEAPTIEAVDHRGEPRPKETLQRLRAEEHVLVWREGKGEVDGRDRYALETSETLIIWTTPPGAPELRATLARVSPKTVHLFGVDPGFDHPKAFLTRLAKLAERAITTGGGLVELSALAAGTAQRQETVRTGLAWLEGRGHIVVLEERDSDVRLAPGEEVPSTDLSGVATRLTSLLEETAAYRTFFARADAETLIDGARAP